MYQGNTCVAGTQRTGYFHVENVKSRFVWVTPTGSILFSKAVEAISPTDGGAMYQTALREKYGLRFQLAFARQALTRIQDWGFNTIGDYSAAYVSPWRTRYSQGGPVKLPEKLLLNLSGRGSYGYVNRLFKNVWKGLDLQGGCRGCYLGYFPDVFDPGFPAGVEAAVKNALTLQPTLPTEPFLMMIMTDDGDNIFGLRRSNALHGGWMAAITSPTQTHADTPGSESVAYADSTIYTKKAWVSYLQNKYVTIQAVNRAWRSSYSSFVGRGWPKRTTGSDALIDEDGTSPWIAAHDRNALSDLNPALRNDLDIFRTMMADKYGSVISGLVRQYIPNHALSNPGPLSTRLVTDPNGRELLRTFAKYYDVLTITGNCDEVGLVPSVYDVAQKPLTVGMIITAQRDSPQSGHKTPFCDASTQPARALAYVTSLTTLVNGKGADGVGPVIGISWWEWTDKSTQGEMGNFGLVTNRDNAYDGVEDRAATCTDKFGYKCGGEAGDYGDFLGPVKQENLALDKALANDDHF